MNNIKTYLSLFSGAGGGDLAFQHLIGLKCLGYVEYESYCQRLLKQRIKDGFLDAAPIFGDIRSFNAEGYAKSYKGMVDVVSGGFPCQPFSTAGKKRGAQDERNMWPATLQAIRIIRPKIAYMENVPGLVSCGYLGVILQDLAESGYNAKWCVLGGLEIGEIVDGKRLWIAAFQATCVMLESMDIQKHTTACSYERSAREHSRAIRKAIWQDDYTRIKRDPDAVARGMERFKAIGNGQVPKLAARAFRLLTGG